MILKRRKLIISNKIGSLINGTLKLFIQVILFGEHAVVFGRTALAVSIDIRTKLTVKVSTEVNLKVKIEVITEVSIWVNVEVIFEVKIEVRIEVSINIRTKLSVPGQYRQDVGKEYYTVY